MKKKFQKTIACKGKCNTENVPLTKRNARRLKSKGIKPSLTVPGVTITFPKDLKR